MFNRRKTINPTVYTLDLNVLPDQYRRRKPSTQSIRLGILFLSFTLILIPVLQLYVNARHDLERIQVDIRQAETELEKFSAVSAEREALQARLEHAVRRATEIEAAYSNVAIQRVDWSTTLNTVTRLVPYSAELLELNQFDDEVFVSGIATDYTQPLDYLQRLRASGLFEIAAIEMVEKIEPDEDTVVIEPEITQYMFEIRLGMNLVADEEEVTTEEEGTE
jgi:Tfp pilus assembly protein PilN